MWTPTTVIDIAHRRELPPYTYRGTLARAVQTCPYADADARLTALCEEHGTGTKNTPGPHTWGTEERLRRLRDAGVPCGEVIGYVLDCQDAVLIEHDTATWRRLRWHENHPARDDGRTCTRTVTVEEWTGDWDDEWEPLDDSEELPATVDWEAPEGYRTAEDTLLSRLGLTRDDMTDSTGRDEVPAVVDTRVDPAYLRRLRRAAERANAALRDATLRARTDPGAPRHV